MDNVGILLIHFKDSPYTKACLDTLVRLKSSYRWTVYVLAMQSKHDLSLAHHPVKPVMIEEKNNLGFSGANNVLIQRAIADGCEAVVLLNNDTEVDPDFLTPLIDQLKDPKVGMVCPKIYFYPGREFHHQDYQKQEMGRVIWYAGGVIDWDHVHAMHWGVDEVDHGQFETSIETDFATGCCIALRIKTIQDIGLMDEKYFLYYEDTDWSLRARNKGYKIIFEPKSVIWHNNGGSTGGAGSDLHMYYQTRNRFRFGFRYAPLKTKLHLLRQAILFLSHPNSTVRKAAQDAMKNNYSPF